MGSGPEIYGQRKLAIVPLSLRMGTALLVSPARLSKILDRAESSRGEYGGNKRLEKCI